MNPVPTGDPIFHNQDEFDYEDDDKDNEIGLIKHAEAHSVLKVTVPKKGITVEFESHPSTSTKSDLTLYIYDEKKKILVGTYAAVPNDNLGDGDLIVKVTEGVVKIGYTIIVELMVDRANKKNIEAYVTIRIVKKQND